MTGLRRLTATWIARQPTTRPPGPAATGSGTVSERSVPGSAATGSGTVSERLVPGSAAVGSGAVSERLVPGSAAVGSGTVSERSVPGSAAVGSGTVSERTVPGSAAVSSGTVSERAVPGSAPAGSGTVTGSAVSGPPPTSVGTVTDAGPRPHRVEPDMTTTDRTDTIAPDVRLPRPHPAPPSPADGAWSADPYSLALGSGRGPLFLRRTDGWLLPLDVERWCAEADAADLEVLRRCEGAVLDVGCGPGRLVAALSRQGRRVLGIDVSEAAVARTLRLGAPALRRSVFEPLPGEGRWGTALLIDGNIGIGGDPAALLARTGRLLAPGGLLIAETVPDLDLDERVQVHVTDARGATGTAFPWARLGTPALLRYAERAGWHTVARWTAGGRSFAALRSDRRTSASSSR